MFTPPSSAEVGSGWSSNYTPSILLHGVYRGKKYLYAEVIHSSGKKMTLEYIWLLLKNKSKKIHRKGRLDPPSELDLRVGH
jgi:hypothetical protein